MSQSPRPGPPALATTSEAGPYNDNSSLSSKALYMKKARLSNLRIFKDIHNNVYYELKVTEKERFWKFLEHYQHQWKHQRIPSTQGHCFCLL